MTTSEIKNQTFDVLKQDGLAEDEKLSVLSEPNIGSKYFDLINLYNLHKNQLDTITNEQIKVGLVQTNKLYEEAKNSGSLFYELFGMNVTLSSVSDSNQNIVTLERFLAVLGYMNAIRGIKCESFLSMQINWTYCSERVRSRKYLFFDGMEHLLASVIMGSADNAFDSDDTFFLYGGSTLMSYIRFCNTIRKDDPTARLLPLESWRKRPANKNSFQGRYPELVSKVEKEINNEGRQLISNLFKNVFLQTTVMEKIFNFFFTSKF